ncbi:hypothetical protein JCM10450v2_007406 [Rhodotorula kratochvilovae]
MPALPAYTPLPAHDEEKAPLSPADSTAPLPRKLADEAARLHSEDSDDEADDAAYYAADQPTRRAAARAAFCTAAVAFVALSVVGIALCGTDGVRVLGRTVGCSGGAREQELGDEHRWRKRQEGGSASGGEEEFSTTTYLGDVTTYVKTTRPIVNPGGYTFGSFTGYVPVPTTTSRASASSAPSTAANSSSSSSESDSAPASASFSRSITELPAAPTASSSASASSSAAEESASSSHLNRQPWASLTASLGADATASPSSATAPSTPTALKLAKRAASPEPAWDFAAVDAHLLHRRGEDFEAAAADEETEEAAATTTGKEEFSTSTNRQGTVFTLVKTTRPIVNPGGYVIGTLDGAWVDVAKQTDRTTLPQPPASTLASASSTAEASPASSAAAAPAEPTATPAPVAEAKEKRRHEELKRRNVVQLVQAE